MTPTPPPPLPLPAPSIHPPTPPRRTPTAPGPPPPAPAATNAARCARSHGSTSFPRSKSETRRRAIARTRPPGSSGALRRGHSRPSARHRAPRPPLLPLPHPPLSVPPRPSGRSPSTASSRPGPRRAREPRAAHAGPAGGWGRGGDEGAGEQTQPGREPSACTLAAEEREGGRICFLKRRGDVAGPMVSKLCCI